MDTLTCSGRAALCAAVLALSVAALPTQPASAEGKWSWGVSAEADRPSGWVRVRENASLGTELNMHRDLDLDHRKGVRFGGVKRLNDRAAWLISLGSYDLEATTTTALPVTFNGATIGAGQLRTTTTYGHYVQIDASYWRRFATFGRGGGLWGGLGGTMVLLNFELKGTVVPALSAGSETREDFEAQELPVPVVGLNLQYPFTDRWSLVGSAIGGRLPRVDSMRTEGGMVRIEQTNTEVSLGLAARFKPDWRVSLSAFESRFDQNEQSYEDGNRIHLRDSGLVVRVGRSFGRSRPDQSSPSPWAPD